MELIMNYTTIENSIETDNFIEEVERFNIDDLIAEIDLAFSNLQNTDRMGDFVKFDKVADLILDIRSKAVKLN